MCAGRPRIRIGSPFRCTHVLRLKLRRRTRGTIGRIQRFAAGFNWARGEDIYRRDDRSISGTRARWRLRADRLVEGDARGVPFPVMSAPTADVVVCGAGVAGGAAADAERVRTCVRPAEEAAARGVGPARMHASLGSDYRPSPADGFEDQPTGTDVIADRTLVRRHFPYLAEDTVALLHARRCGWFSGQQLGMYLLERAREKGVRLVEGRVERVEVAGGRVRGVTAATRGGARTFSTPRFVNAAGPVVQRGRRLIRVELPVVSQRHAKVSLT